MRQLNSSKLAESAQDTELSRAIYCRAALPQIPRLLGMLDRNPYRATYGCFDRQFWHYRTACFPSEMYQEGVLPLALVFARQSPGNRWHANAQVREWIIAGLRYSAKSCHTDGSCDDYYPHERALGAAVFSFAAATEACRLIQFNSRDREYEEVLAWLRLRAHWIAGNGESGTLANHHALAALGLFRMADISGEAEFAKTGALKLREVLAMQDTEGWFLEYGGADPGYQTVTVDCLAKIRSLLQRNASVAGVASVGGLTNAAIDEALNAAVEFCEHFLQPDGCYGGAYGSRGTLHFYPHGFELLAQSKIAAAESAARLAYGFRKALANDAIGHFDDDRMFVHRLGNLLEACKDSGSLDPGSADTSTNSTTQPSHKPRVTQFPNASMLVVRSGQTHSVVSAARGGVFAHYKDEGEQGDAGLIVQLSDGRVAVSQSHDVNRSVRFEDDSSGGGRVVYSVRTPLHFTRFETVTPLKQSILHLGMVTVGRFCRTLVRRVLQKRVITGRSIAPIVLTRKFEFLFGDGRDNTRSDCDYRLRVTDHIELTDPKVFVQRMSFGVGFEAAYVAASGVYRHDQLRPWQDLDAELAELNAVRRVEVVREFGAHTARAEQPRTSNLAITINHSQGTKAAA